MANIIDYVHWRGDLPVSQVPLGEVDALVLSYLAYMDFSGVAPAGWQDGGVLLSDAAAHLMARSKTDTCVMDSAKDDCRLLTALQGSERFGTMRVLGCVDRFDREREEQFAAVTFVPAAGPAVVAFRGTDTTVVGWKEDFNMSFSDEVPSQRAALAYVSDAVQALGMPVVLSGHSKGGNLAAYAGIFAEDAVQRRIECVYNFDGPGFNERITALPAFRQIDMRIHTFVTQSSMIGIIMWHAEPFTVVKSDANGVLQHNPYSWQVMAGRLITLPERTSESRLAEETIKHWLAELTPDARRQFIDGIYAVLSVSEGRNVVDLFEAKNVRAILRAAGSMDEPTREAIAEAFRLLGNSLKETIPEWIDRAADDLRARIAPKGEERGDGDGQEKEAQ